MNTKPKVPLLPRLARDTALDYVIVLLCAAIAAAAVIYNWLI